MGTLKENAVAYTPKQTRNISELDSVDVNLAVLQGQGKDTEGKPFFYSYIEQNGEEYRVPDSVISELKEILKIKPDLVKFKVTKTGSGMATRYRVMPI